MELKFRRLAPDDFNSCLSLWGGVRDSYPHPVGGAWDRHKIKEEMDRHGGIGAFFVQMGSARESPLSAENKHGVMLAFCLYRPSPGVKEVTLLATSPSAQRQGVMKALLRSLIDELGADEKVWLEVHSENTPARLLYAKLGFRQCGRRPSYYSDGGDALLYEFNFQSSI